MQVGINNKNRLLISIMAVIAILSAAVFIFADDAKQDVKPTLSATQNSAGQKSIQNPVGGKKLVYIASDTRIPFWSIMAKGVKNMSNTLGYSLVIDSPQNDPKKELEIVARAIDERVSGIIISPTTSSACATILKLAKNSSTPVVIADIGTDGGDYVSYISSDNREGAYEIGKVLAKELTSRGWGDGSVGIVAIPQKRLNGQARTEGFMRAMKEANIRGADIKQQVQWTEEETYRYSLEMIRAHKDLRAIWLQGSDRYNGALRAIADSGNRGKILLLTFDAEPEFLDLIPKGVIVGSAMQQPYLMGQEAVKAMDTHLKGGNAKKDLQLPILAISAENIAQKLPVIKRNVLGIEN